MKVGLIGLGRMGTAMARRVLAAGHDLLVYNRTPQKAADLVQAGARAAASVSAACADREVLITMVADDSALQEVALASGGVRDSLPQGATHVAMGTHGVAAVRAIEEAHIAARQSFIAAPVLGRPDAVDAGKLGIVAAGPASALATCAPVFGAIGGRVFHAGRKPESATAIKLANNFVLACCIEALGEAFALARKYDVAPMLLFEVLTEGLFAAPAYKTYGSIIAEERYEHVGFTTRLGLKDTNLVLAAAESAGVPLPSANLVRDRLLSAIAHGDGDRDWSVIAREQARASGLD
jgi:3-hydroxyisobutyrate dehydrogenase-like beta-hydroxyacid dehydrogenase